MGYEVDLILKIRYSNTGDEKTKIAKVCHVSLNTDRGSYKAFEKNPRQIFPKSSGRYSGLNNPLIGKTNDGATVMLKNLNLKDICNQKEAVDLEKWKLKNKSGVIYIDKMSSGFWSLDLAREK